MVLGKWDDGPLPGASAWPPRAVAAAGMDEAFRTIAGLPGGEGGSLASAPELYAGLARWSDMSGRASAVDVAPRAKALLALLGGCGFGALHLADPLMLRHPDPALAGSHLVGVFMGALSSGKASPSMSEWLRASERSLRLAALASRVAAARESLGALSASVALHGHGRRRR